MDPRAVIGGRAAEGVVVGGALSPVGDRRTDSEGAGNRDENGGRLRMTVSCLSARKMGTARHRVVADSQGANSRQNPAPSTFVGAGGPVGGSTPACRGGLRRGVG